MAKIGEGGHERGVFVLGGPFGHGSEVVKRANESVRLSKMVLNHRVARLVLAEQCHRAHDFERGTVSSLRSGNAYDAWYRLVYFLTKSAPDSTCGVYGN